MEPKSSLFDATSLPGPEAGLEELLKLARSRYDVRFEPVQVGGRTLDILQLADMSEHIDKLERLSGDEAITLPFWAMIWPAAILLGHYMGRVPATMPDGTPTRVLELGAGLGLSGLAAAAHGLTTVISDANPDAVLFARINILHNNLQDKAQARFMDYTQSMDERFHVILGAEVVYRDDHARPLVKFLCRHLAAAPGAHAVLGLDYTRKAKKFFSLAEEHFHVDTKVIGCKETGKDTGAEKHLCAIHRLKPRKGAATAAGEGA